MADVARGYGELLAEAHAHWQQSLASALAAGSGEARASERRGRRAIAASPVCDRFSGCREPPGGACPLFDDAPVNDEIVKRRVAINAWLANTGQAAPRAHTLVECPVPFDPRILLRGNPMRPGKHVPRQFLHVLCQGSPRPFAVGCGRLELAEAIADRDNPLTARVLVNRVWADHFGVDFGRYAAPGRAPDRFQ